MAVDRVLSSTMYCKACKEPTTELIGVPDDMVCFKCYGARVDLDEISKEEEEEENNERI